MRGESQLRVLLVSPAPNHDPFNGDVVYTESLLRNPPPGVDYVDYVSALASGELVEHGRRAAYNAAQSGRERVRELAFLARDRAVNGARSRGWLFREPFRHFEIVGQFDLVHCHVFSARWDGRNTPMVFSNALPIAEVYSKARGWSQSKTRRAEYVDRTIARLTGVRHIASALESADSIVAFTETLRRWYIDIGARTEVISVVPCSPGHLKMRQDLRVPRRVGFVAGDFAAKGGRTLLGAWEQVAQRLPDATLVIAGAERPADIPEEAGVSWLGRIDREALLNEVMPTFDVFAYPSRFDGLPLTLLEALALGLPVVVSDYFALPEVVGPMESCGAVVPEGDVPALAAAIVRVLDPSVRAAASAAARRRFEEVYSPDVTASKLRASYDDAIKRFKGKQRRV